MPTGDPFKKVRPGDKLRIPSAAYNAFIDTTLAQRARQQNTGSQDTPTFRQSGIIQVKNCTGSNLERFCVVGLDDPIFLPDENEDSFKNRVAFDGVTPTEDDHTGKFAILLEPLNSGSIGQACVDGVCPARVYWPYDFGGDDPPEFADVGDYQTWSLQAAESGAAQILWLDSDVSRGSTGWAVVRLGLPPQVGVRPCLVQQTGGSDGAEGTYASWTYNIYRLSDTGRSNALAYSLEVDNSPARIFTGPGITPAESGSVGLYYTKPDGSLGLYTVPEKIASCS